MTEGTDPAAGDPLAAWAASGAMALTGHPDGPPLSPAAAVIPALDTLARRYTHLATLIQADEAADHRPPPPSSNPVGRSGPGPGRPPAPTDGCGTAGRTSGARRSIGPHPASSNGAPVPRARGATPSGPVDIDVGQLVSGRAALLGLGRQGRVSANGSCRLLPTADGWVAINLARPSDVEAVGALVERVVDDDPWIVLARRAERMPGADLVERAVLLGLPAALVPAARPTPPGPQASGGPPAAVPFADRAGKGEPVQRATGERRGPSPPADPRVTSSTVDVDAWTGRIGLHSSPSTAADALGAAPATVASTSSGAVQFALRELGPGAARVAEVGRGPLTVVDLSGMWAGPLCARLLGLAGLRIVKVESTRRPDGARAGDARFFDWLHGGHASVALDLASSGGRAALAQLVAVADVVIESSRPRALAQLGIDAAAVVAGRPGVSWVSITGHGRQGAAGQRVAFGDDAAAAAGLVAYDDQARPVFCADAIADPIAGLTAAVGALTSIAAGGGHLVDVPMVDAVAATLARPAAPAAARRSADGTWQVATPTGVHPVAAPRPFPPGVSPAHPLGADTTTVLQAVAPARR